MKRLILAVSSSLVLSGCIESAPSSGGGDNNANNQNNVNNINNVNNQNNVNNVNNANNVNNVNNANNVNNQNNTNSCVAWDDAEFCQQNNANCGMVSGEDNCGNLRTIDCELEPCEPGSTCTDNLCSCDCEIADYGCLVEGARQPGSDCNVCNPDNPTDWSFVPFGESCDSDDLCAPRGTCEGNSGECVGDTKDCEALVNIGVCERAFCNPSNGNCEIEAALDDPCDAGNPCQSGICNAQKSCVPNLYDQSMEYSSCGTNPATMCPGFCESGNGPAGDTPPYEVTCRYGKDTYSLSMMPTVCFDTADNCYAVNSLNPDNECQICLDQTGFVEWVNLSQGTCMTAEGASGTCSGGTCVDLNMGGGG